MGVMSKNPTNTVNLEAKTLLAKLLASEDITVSHQHVETAMFNVETRVLTLPMWESMDSTLYDMLVGHEVGHAIFTPNDISSSIGKVDPSGEFSQGVVFDYLNVVEDARIERLMQDKFPGLRRDFVRSYNDLFDRDFFGVGDEDINDRRLVDRVNLHYKVGRLLQIEFSAREQAVIDMIDRAETWEDTLEATRALFTLGREEAENQAEEEQEGEESDLGAPMMGMEGEGDTSGMSEDGGEESDSEGEGQGESAGEGEGEGGEGDGSDSTDGDSTDLAHGDHTVGAGYGKPNVEELMKSETMSDFENSIKHNFVKEDTTNRKVVFANVTIPDTITKEFVVTVPQFVEICTNYGAIKDASDFRWTKLCEQLARFERETKKIVSGMVQRFEMMKAAHVHKRTATADTGMIDMSKLSGYKWDDNIFLKSEEVADGKNHGMIMYVDWSGSMCCITNDTMKQVLILAMFCKKVNIPFSCYAFIGGFRGGNKRTMDEVGGKYRGLKHGDAVFADIKLVEIATSEYDKAMTRKGMAFWLGVAAAEDASGDGYRYPVVDFRQGGTPLDDAMAIGINIANEFREKHSIEVLSTVVLTDGQTSSSPLMHQCEAWNEERGFTTTNLDAHDEDAIVRRVLYSKVTGKTYRARNNYEGTTSTMMEYYKDHTGSNTTCIQIVPQNRKDVSYFVGWATGSTDINAHQRAEITERIMKEGSYILTDLNNFEQFIFMASQGKKKVKGMDEVKKGANTRVLANAFIREKKSRKRLTQIMDQFVDYISKEYV